MSDKSLNTQALDLAIKGEIVLPGSVLHDGVLGIRGEHIAGIYQHDAIPPHRQYLDVGCQYVLPGAIDAHVHCFSAPQEGFTHATRSAAAGGVTTIIEMPYDAGAPVITAERLRTKQDRLEEEAVVDVALLATIKKVGGLDEIPRIAEAGVCGFKMSLYETDPDRFPRIPDDELLEAFTLIKETGLPVGLHAENDEVVKRATARQRKAAKPEPTAHSASRPRVAESEAVLRALEFAHWTGVQLHIYHATFPRVFELVDWFRGQGVRVTAETCVHYLVMTEDDLTHLEGRAKVNPPLRSTDEQGGLWTLCAGDKVAMVTSDHAPWTLDRKAHTNIFDNASGMPGVKTLLPLLFSEGVAKGRLSIHDLVRLLAENPARVFGLSPRKGQIQVGADADLVILDPDIEWVFDEQTQHSTAGWSPYHGRPMMGRVTRTIVRGETVYEDEMILAQPGFGQFVPPTTSLGKINDE
jgi:allantoinase